MIVYGKQVIVYLLDRHPSCIEEIFLTKEIPQKLFFEIKKTGAKITLLDFKKAQAMARGGNHQGFLAKISPIKPTSFAQMLSFSKLLILCGVSDVGNIGSLIRSAYALGVEGIVLDRCFSTQAIESMIRLSSGAMLDLPFCFTDHLLDLINQIKQSGFICYGADMGGKERIEKTLSQKWALFLGSEGDGLNGKMIKKMDKIISIKMKNGFDSLNVSVAGGILMYKLTNGEEKWKI